MTRINNKKYSSTILLKLFLLCFSCTGFTANLGQGTEQNFDIVILNGRVIDPETQLDAIRNVGIKGDKIVSVTQEPIKGTTIIDAENKVVAPGFIDMHAHGQRILEGRVQAMDGVTTALELEAGLLPVANFYEQAKKEGRPIHYGTAANWAHARIAEKLNVEPENNAKFFFGNLQHKSWQHELATDSEMEGIVKRVRQGLDEGGLGIGFLLGYAPGTGRKEYFELNKLAAEYNVPTFTHARYASAIEPRSTFEAIQEMIAISASTGAHMHVCHLNSISSRDIKKVASLIKTSQQAGIPISVEAYPYGAGATGIGSAMFKGPEWQKRLGGVKKSDFTLNSHSLTDSEFDELQKNKPETGIVVHFLKPENSSKDQDMLDMSVLFPGGTIAADGGLWLDNNSKPLEQHTWPLPNDANAHPRTAGTYAKFLRVYVRERQKISLLQGIAKTSFNAVKILQESIPQLRSKGRIQEGADADIVVFDLQKIRDRATFKQPSITSTGMDHVIVAGTQLVVGGVMNTSVLPGRPIRREINKK